MKLYFSRNYNPRLAVAAARYLSVDVEYEFAAPLEPSQRERFRPHNPNLLLPTLIEGGESLWEADAIACRLSQIAGSDFWPTGPTTPDMIRWISWGRSNFVAACDKVHFEHVTKRRYSIGATDEAEVDSGLKMFATAAAMLDDHLRGAKWLLSDGLSYADFRMACVLPFAELAGLPLDRYPHVAVWHGRLLKLDAWRQPFKGLAGC